MADKQVEKTKFQEWLFETGKPLTWVREKSAVCYPTLENLVFARLLRYNHRTLRDVAKVLKWSIPDLLQDIVTKNYETAKDKKTVVTLCKRYNIPTDVKVPVRKKPQKAKGNSVEISDNNIV